MPCKEDPAGAQDVFFREIFRRCGALRLRLCHYAVWDRPPASALVRITMPGGTPQAPGNPRTSVMTGNDGLVALIRILNEVGTPYMLVGSYSSNFYGIPRSTKDADLVFQFDSRSLSEIAKRLPEGLSFDQQSTFEMVTATRKEVILIEWTWRRIASAMPNQNERKAGRMQFAYGHPVWAAPMRSRRYRSFWIAATLPQNFAFICVDSQLDLPRVRSHPRRQGSLLASLHAAVRVVRSRA